MKNVSLAVRMILVLTLICVLAGGVLAGWDMFTKPRIEFHRAEALKAAIKQVLPAHDSYETRESGAGTLYLASKNNSDQLVGVAFMAVGSGFQGELRIMVGLTPDLSQLTGIQVLEQIETPGLGTKIVEDPTNKSDPFWFPAQFQGVPTTPDLVVIKNALPSKKYEIQGITGATISSKAVTQVLNESIAAVKTALSEQGGPES